MKLTWEQASAGINQLVLTLSEYDYRCATVVALAYDTLANAHELSTGLISVINQSVVFFDDETEPYSTDVFVSSKTMHLVETCWPVTSQRFTEKLLRGPFAQKFTNDDLTECIRHVAFTAGIPGALSLGPGACMLGAFADLEEHGMDADQHVNQLRSFGGAMEKLAIAQRRHVARTRLVRICS